MTTMEPYRRKLFRLSLITCIICHVLRHTSGIHAQQMEPLASEVMAPTSESPGGAMFAPDSSNLALTSSPSFPSSLDLPPAHLNTHDFASPDQRPESGQACTWDVIAATLSDDQLLKKALQVYSSRHGINKMREVIVMATGLVFRPDITESLNSVLPPDMPSNPAPAIPMAIFRDSGESGMKNPEQVYAVSPSPFAEMLRGAINAGPSGVDESGSSHLLRSGSSSDEVPNPVTAEPPAVVMYDRLSSNHPNSSPERFLIIPGRRQRPFGTKVRVMVRNKIREVKITSSPRMSVYDALKQAEKKVQYLFPELSGQRVIHMERRLVESKDGIRDCSTITKVGRVEENEANSWFIRVSYSPGTQLVYEGRCVPSEREVHVRPATTIDLIFAPVTSASSESLS